MRIILVILLILAVATPANAQTARDLFLLPETNMLVDDPKDLPDTVQDFANIYYGHCIQANTDPRLKEYNSMQCACAASAMPEILTLEDAQKLFDPRNKSDIQFTRFMTLAYAPCLEQTIPKLAYDSCFGTETMKKMTLGHKICQCVGKGMGEFMQEAGGRILPGIKVYGYDMELANGDMLSYAVAQPAFEERTQYFSTTCMQGRIYGRYIGNK